MRNYSLARNFILALRARWLLAMLASPARCLVLEIHRWPRSLSSLVGASTPRYYFTVLKLDRNTTDNAMVLEFPLLVILVELVSISVSENGL